VLYNSLAGNPKKGDGMSEPDSARKGNPCSGTGGTVAGRGAAVSVAKVVVNCALSIRISDAADAVGGMARIEVVKEPFITSLVNRDSAPKRARSLAVELDVGELNSLGNVRSREAVSAFNFFWQLGLWLACGIHCE
jgi:hypothetical protein